MAHMKLIADFILVLTVIVTVPFLIFFAFILWASGYAIVLLLVPLAVITLVAWREAYRVGNGS
jgi:hypothetical protein